MSIVFLISDLSRSAESNVVDSLCRALPGLDLAISHTTRAPRVTEKDGREFIFVSREDFERLISREEFLEYASVFGNYYGTSRRFLNEARERSHDLLICGDSQGAAKIRETTPDAVRILIVPAEPRKTVSRLDVPWLGRPTTGIGTATGIKRQKGEGESHEDYDHIVVNRNPEECSGRLSEIVLSERSRRSKSGG